VSVAYPWLEPPWPSKKMPREQLEDTLQKLLAQKNICVLATIGENGRPIASPIEYYADGLDLYMLPDPGTPKLKAMQRDPYMSLSVNLDYFGWQSARGLQYFAQAEIIEPHAPGWDHGMDVFHWKPWMEDLGMDSSKPFERQVAKIVPYRILLTDTWLWKNGYSAKQVWERDA